MSLAIASPVPLAANSYASLMAKNWGPNATPKSAAFKNINMVAGQLVTLLNYAGGPGVISSLSMYHPTTGATTKTNGFNGVISVYIDGEATPSLTYDLGGPLGWFQAGGAVWTANMNNAIVGGFSAGTALNSVFSNNFFPIPWHRVDRRHLSASIFNQRGDDNHAELCSRSLFSVQALLVRHDLRSGGRGVWRRAV